MNLVGSPNAGSFASDEDARDARDGVLVINRVVELELDDAADLPLALGVEHVERIRAAVAIGVLFERREPDLRAVAVHNDGACRLRHSTKRLRGRPRGA